MKSVRESTVRFDISCKVSARLFTSHEVSSFIRPKTEEVTCCVTRCSCGLELYPYYAEYFYVSFLTNGQYDPFLLT